MGEPVFTATKTPIDAAITQAEYNLIRRIRQVKRQKLAEGIYIDFAKGTLQLVGKTEAFDCVTITKSDT